MRTGADRKSRPGRGRHRARQKIGTALGLLREPYRGWMTLSVLGSLVISGMDMLGVAATLPLMQLITGGSVDAGAAGVLSRLLRTEDPGTVIVAMAAVICSAFLVKSVITVVFRWWLLGRSTSLSAQASAELFRRYMHAPYLEHRQRRLSEIHRALGTAVPQTFSQIVMGFLGLLPDLLTLVAVSAVLFAVSPLGAVLAVLFFGTVAGLTQSVLKPAHQRIGREVVASDLATWEALMPGLNGFRESRLSGTTQRFVAGYAAARMRGADAARRLSLVSELPKYILEIALIVGVALVAVVLFQVFEPAQALSVLGVFAVAAVRVVPVLNRALATMASIRSATAGLDILVEQIEELDASEDHPLEPASGERFTGDVVLDHVSFGYPGDEQPVIDDVSVRIAAGTTVAFVGGSGAGKSTLLDVVLGLLPPRTGTLTCGGREVAEDVAQWHSQIGVVPQDVFLMDASLRANIAYGMDEDEIDDDALARAAERAELSPIVARLPEGFDTRLGERGVRLSGGQRQRVGIARALYRDPDILVLDEATSALDNLTEERITRTIDSLRGDMTILVVAHRLSTVKHADRVMYMSEGKIQSEGTFSEVAATNREFAHLVELGRLT